MVRLLIALSLIVACLAPLRPSHAQDGVEQKPSALQKLLPSLQPKDDYDPYVTMKAPFADDRSKESEINLYRQSPEEGFKTMNTLQKSLSSSAKAVPVTLPHATLQEIEDWVITATSNALTFSENSGEELKKAITFFTPSGRIQYLKFLKSNSLIDILKSKQYRVNTIFQHRPLLLKETEANGRYKWVFETELLTTYLPLSAKDYRAATARNENFKLQLQITRAPDEENPQDGLLIEVWQVKDE